MKAGCFSCFGKRKCEKRPIIDESVRNMPQEAKPALAFTLFYTYGMGPAGDPSVAVKQMWIFKISGEVSYWEDEKLAQNRQ